MDISIPEIDGRIHALTEQRNDAMNQAVLLNGRLAAAQHKIGGLEKEIADLKPKPETEARPQA